MTARRRTSARKGPITFNQAWVVALSSVASLLGGIVAAGAIHSQFVVPSILLKTSDIIRLEMRSHAEQGTHRNAVHKDEFVRVDRKVDQILNELSAVKAELAALRAQVNSK